MINLARGLIRAVVAFSPKNSQVILLTPVGTDFGIAADALKVIEIEAPKGRWFGKWHWYNRRLPCLIEKYNADVFYSLSGILSRPVLMTDAASLSTVNNMLPFTSRRDSLIPLLSLSALKYFLLKRAYLWGCRNAHAVILHSEYAKQTIEANVEEIDKKTVVALNGLPFDFVVNADERERHCYESKPYFFFLSVVYKYKNHLNLIRGYHKALKENEDLPDLLFAGPIADKGYFKDICRLIDKKNLSEKVKYLGVLPREDIPGWIHNASINLFPSTCETNSVVLAEVLGLGGVLACSNIGPMPEVAGVAAKYFDPHDPGTISRTILDLWGNPEERLWLRGSASVRIKEMSWENCGKAVWEAFTIALENKRKRELVK